MLKKFFSCLLAVLVMNFAFLPAFANHVYGRDYSINTNLVSDLNVNKSSKGQIVQFKSTQDCPTESGFVIPAGTLFNGTITSMKKGRFGFRRAKARIKINEIVLPDGRKYATEGHTNPRVFKGSAIGNIFKGLFCAPLAICAGALGAAVIVVETVTIVGILLVPPTAALVGGSMGKLTNGINCKKYVGTNINIDVRANIIDYPAMNKTDKEAQSFQVKNYIPNNTETTSEDNFTETSGVNAVNTDATVNQESIREQNTDINPDTEQTLNVNIIHPDMLNPAIRNK